MHINKSHYKQYIAVIGGSISGSEAANILANSGFKVVVFEMNTLPYGKIEDGLPNWHINLRNRQIKEIDNKLKHPNIEFVPNFKIGENISFKKLKDEWGFTAIILANGAWQDRQLHMPNIGSYLNKEFIYQNAFINWFNHKHEHNYKGINYFIKDKVVVIGGGLASLDVIKIVMMELVKKQLFLQKGIDVDLFALEKEGIHKILNKHQVTITDLGVQKAILVYRRTAKDMPLKSPKDDSEQSIEKAKKVSERLLNKYCKKYMFNFIQKSIPVGINEESGVLKGIVLQNVQLVNGKVLPIENSFNNIDADMIISSIGSVPEKIAGLPYQNSSLKLKESSSYQVEGFNNVFAVGNAVTGRGNIQESKQHGRQITKQIIEKHLKEDALERWLENHNATIKNNVKNQLNDIIKEIIQLKEPSLNEVEGINFKIKKLHKKRVYENYVQWIEDNMPVRLESLVKK